MKAVWNDGSILLSSKIQLMRSLVTSIFQYACESWTSLIKHSRTPKKNTSHGIEVLPQDSTHLMQRPCYRRGSPCQDPAGNRTTRRPPNHRKETQTSVVWLCLPFIRSGQNHLASYCERGKKKRQTEEVRGGKTTSGNGQAWSLPKSQRAVENWEKWGTLVLKSPMVPQRPSRLRDR